MRFAAMCPLIKPWCVSLVCLLLPAVAFAKVDHLPPDERAEVEKQLPKAFVLEGGVRFLVRKEGTGLPIMRGDQVTALYVGRFLDGTIFNQKRSRFHMFHFEVGAQPRQIIAGWDVAIRLMRKGGHYTIAIPSPLGYGKEGRSGQVPPDRTLVFDIEIVDVERPGR